MRVVDMRGLLWCLSRGPLAALARSKLRARKRADHGIFRVLSTSFDVARVVQGVDARLDSYVAQSGPRTATRHRRSHPQMRQRPCVQAFRVARSSMIRGAGSGWWRQARMPVGATWASSRRRRPTARSRPSHRRPLDQPPGQLGREQHEHQSGENSRRQPPARGQCADDREGPEVEAVLEQRCPLFKVPVLAPGSLRTSSTIYSLSRGGRLLKVMI
jgi:hypothetical protein